ncbi:MAG: S41 family peptidase, partial [Bacteroidota bacterium]
KADMPVDPDETLNPDDFFTSLRSPEDRFSWIQEDYQELLGLLQGVTLDPGHEIRYLGDAQNPGNRLGQILYVKPDSPSDLAGMKRGDLITHVNGTVLTDENFRDLNGDMEASHELTFLRYSPDSDLIEELGPVTINPVQFQENPNFLDTIYNYEGSNVGYYVYNRFSSGPTAADQTYQNEMDGIFQSFRSGRINELIIDLRYNPGGSISVATNLGSLIAPGVTTQDIFAQREYNDDLQQLILNDATLGSSFLEDNFTFKAQNVGSLLGRVYILTGSRTASASELLINGLEPFMEVRVIGDTTSGKNQASVTRFEENDPNNTWGMQPIVATIANAVGFSDYADGLAPDIFDVDVSRQVFPLGDIRENLLSQALEDITGLLPARIRRFEDFSLEGYEDSNRNDTSPIQLDDQKSKELLRRLR